MSLSPVVLDDFVGRDATNCSAVRQASTGAQRRSLYFQFAKCTNNTIEVVERTGDRVIQAIYIFLQAMY